MTPSHLRRAAVLTSGGDAPGMNAAIRAVIRRGAFRGLEMFGIHNGFAGLITNDFQPMGPRDVARISHLGGTVLGTTRCDEFRTNGDRGFLVGMQGAEITATPLHQIVGKQKAIKPELFHLAQSLAK